MSWMFSSAGLISLVPPQSIVTGRQWNILILIRWSSDGSVVSLLVQRCYNRKSRAVCVLASQSMSSLKNLTMHGAKRQTTEYVIERAEHFHTRSRASIGRNDWSIKLTYLHFAGRVATSHEPGLGGW